MTSGNDLKQPAKGQWFAKTASSVRLFQTRDAAYREGRATDSWQFDSWHHQL